MCLVKDLWGHLCKQYSQQYCCEYCLHKSFTKLSHLSSGVQFQQTYSIFIITKRISCHYTVHFGLLRGQSPSNIDHLGIICCFDRENTKRLFAHILLLLGYIGLPVIGVVVYEFCHVPNSCLAIEHWHLQTEIPFAERFIYQANQYLLRSRFFFNPSLPSTIRKWGVTCNSL